jgi:hypothetical protein
MKAAELKLKVYDKLIEVTNRELDQDIIKKFRPSCPRVGNRERVEHYGCVPATWL